MSVKILGQIVGLIGLAILYQTNKEICLGVFLMAWADNLILSDKGDQR